VVDKSSFGNAGNAILFKRNVRRDGADPPKNPSGRTNSSSSIDSSERYVSAENGHRIMSTNTITPILVRELSRISDTRSGYFSAATKLKMLLGALQEGTCMAMGNGGQISNDFLARFLKEQTSVRFRCSGDAKIRCRHLRHTCTNGSHHDRLDE